MPSDDYQSVSYIILEMTINKKRNVNDLISLMKKNFTYC
jgi:hypothetical protein